MSNRYVNIRNKVLFEALMNPKFHKDKKNFILKEIGGMGGAHEESVMKALSNPDPKIQAINDYWGHLVLDFLGVLDPTPAADLANALWYYLEGDKINAFFSCVGAAVPYALDVVKVTGRVMFNFLKGGKLTADIAGTAIEKFLEHMQAVSYLLRKFKELIENFLEFAIEKAGPSKFGFFIDWVRTTFQKFVAFIDNLILKSKAAKAERGTATSTTETMNIAEAFEDFFDSTFKNTAEAFDPATWSKRYSQIFKRPLTNPIAFSAQAGIYALLAQPWKRWAENRKEDLMREIEVISENFQQTSAPIEKEIAEISQKLESETSSENYEELRKKGYKLVSLSQDIQSAKAATYFMYVYYSSNKDSDITAMFLKLLSRGIEYTPADLVQSAIELKFVDSKIGNEIIEQINATTEEIISSDPRFDAMGNPMRGVPLGAARGAFGAGKYFLNAQAKEEKEEKAKYEILEKIKKVFEEWQQSSYKAKKVTTQIQNSYLLSIEDSLQMVAGARAKATERRREQ